MPTLLVAVDDSTYAAKAVDTAATLAKGLAADVIVFHLRTDDLAARGPVEAGESADAASDSVKSAVAALQSAGVASVTGRVDHGLAGEAANAILDVAKQVNADFIVMGHRGTGRLSGLLLGSVAHKVISLADRPVVVAR